ncbi:autotransporter assembly complex protein TamA [Sphingomonas sp. AX6]|uniref:autotransporter assembly complex protein TamA n=1 Tax=Sphingomonas sp. AX6 TaxID=2653171 RepID=UPI0012F3AD03|nr:autotransporter assembly complex family protein [Sphingomonas sp. AX6]VXC42619.1 Outer membrane protein [Sphingomonas sp. AX6]
MSRHPGRATMYLRCAAVFSVTCAAVPVWAQDVPPPIVADEATQDDSGLDPNTPLAPLPDIGVDWPDLGTPLPEEQAVVTDEAGQPLDTPAATASAQSEYRSNYRITGIDGVGGDLLRQRFNELSVLRANEDEPANAAQIDRRAREDADLLGTLLEAEGYYAARIGTSVATEGERLIVTLDVRAGEQYRIAAVELPGLEAAGARTESLRNIYGIAPDTPFNADEVAAAEERLRTNIGREGFPFAEIRPSEVVIDHATQTATLLVQVDPGGERRFGRILKDNDRVFGADHVADLARFSPGDLYNEAALDDLRRAIVQTGLVSSVRAEPVEGAEPGTVDIQVALEPAPPRTIAGELGYGTGEGARAEVSWTHRNLFPPEGALTLRGVLGTKEQLAGIIFRRSNFHGRDRVLTGQITAAHLERDAYEADTVSISGSLERQTNIFFQKTWTWSLGAELVATDERDVIVDTGEARRRTYFIGALPTSLNYDGSDDLLNPTRGFRLGGRFSPEVSLSGATFGYARVQIDASGYYPVNDRVVIAGRVRAGTIAGAPRDAIAPSRRFYAGGGASVRGYGFQRIGPRDANNDPIGGRSLTEFSLEARVKAFGNFGVVPFLDGGNIYTDPLPRLSGFRYGAGLGVRYYSNFGPIRVDVGTPLNPQEGDPRIAVYVSLGQAF